MGRTSLIERVKTLLIVVLLFTTVLLLYFFWKGSYFGTWNFPLSFSQYLSPEEELLPTEDMIVPRTVCVNFGSDNYAQYIPETKTLWHQFLEQYIIFSQSENVILEEISAEQWTESMDRISIQYLFDYGLSPSALEALGAAKISPLSSVDSISTIAYSIASVESIFLFDRENMKYYRLVSDVDHTNLQWQISELETVYYNDHYPDACYPMDLFFGINNGTFLPFTDTTLLPVLYTEKVSNELSDAAERRLTQSYFGENLDFIRKIKEDNGTTIYIYGYGQKVFTISPFGWIEYKEEASADYIGTSQFEALQLASAFISTHGGWNYSEENVSDIYLRYAQKTIKDKKDVYFFCFGIKNDNYPLYSEKGNQILVELVGKQITYFYREQTFFPSFIEEENTDPVNEIMPYSIIDILSSHYETIYNNLSGSNLLSLENQSPDDRFNFVTEQITSIDIGYFEQEQEDYAAYMPVWIISFPQADVFFDLYSGSYLGLFNKKQRR